ncbi:protein kinase domain-containing protein [Nocardia sp. NPDC004123]
MAMNDSAATERYLTPSIAAELAAAGFHDAEEIGHGGFGTVYRCRQPSLDRTVAIKVLTAAETDTENLKRFLREQRAMGRLSGHPNIARILEAGATPTGRPYIVMEYHARDSLAARIRTSGPLEWARTLRLGVKLAGALETAHRLGVLHRDVKPANILLTDYGEPQLTDFGIARIAGGFETGTGAITGSPAYTAPEVLQGQSPTVRSDLYSLGATLFSAITGHAAFERRNGEQVVAQFLRITTHPVPDLRGQGVPDEVCVAIEEAMAVSPEGRPPSALEFGRALQLAQRRIRLPVDEIPLPTNKDIDDSGPSAVQLAPSAETSGYPHESASPPTPSTRYRPPTILRAPVLRQRLVDRLRAGGRRRLILIHAPAGFGKSTLALQYRDSLITEGAGVAWLTVDHDDNNVVWFLEHVIEAIRRIRPPLARELASILEQHGDTAERCVLASLIDDIHDRDERLVIILDDWHRVTSTATTDALAFLLDNACHHLQVIITSRTRFGLPTGRMRVRDELVEIDADTLRFDVTEACSLVESFAGVHLAQFQIDELQQSTVGWAAALQLVSLSLREQTDPTELIAHLSGRHHAIDEFLTENVLTTLEPEMVEFLMATSITERISGELASELSRTHRGPALLEEAERRDLFLRRIDDEGEWLRYHPMFADFLRHRLERDQPDRIGELHRAASQWFADHRFLSEAVDHALAAGDQDRAIGLVEQQGTSLLEHSRMATLLGLVAKLPPRLAMSRPRLQIAVATANIQLQQTSAAQTALDLVYALLDRGNHNDGERADLRIEADVLRGAMKIAADDIEGVDELVAECLGKPDSLPPWIVSGAADIATFVAIYRFDYESARRMQNWANPYHERTGGRYFTMYGHCFAGIAANEQLDLSAAESEFRTALAVARESGGLHSQAARLAGALLGELLYERNELAEAERLIDEGFEVGPEGGVVDFMLARYGTGAQIKALRGDLGSACERLNEGARVAEALSLGRLRARIYAERIQWGLLTGSSDNQGANRDCREPTSAVAAEAGDDGIALITAEFEQVGEIRGLIAEKSLRKARLASARARTLVAHLATQGRPKALLKAKLLCAAALFAADLPTEAKSVLAPAAAVCADLGLIRLLLDGGREIVPIVAELFEDQRNDRWQPEWPSIPESFFEAILEAAARS